VIRLLPILLLAGCVSPGGEAVVAEALHGLAMTPAERCAEARASADDLTSRFPAEAAKWRALELAACAGR
jgi:hypothetical protein